MRATYAPNSRSIQSSTPFLLISNLIINMETNPKWECNTNYVIIHTMYGDTLNTYRFHLHTRTPNVPIGHELFKVVLKIFIPSQNV